MGRQSWPSQEQAEAIALQALAWLIADEGLAGRFLALTGCDGQTLRQRLELPETLGSVLDFLLEDEKALLNFALEAQIIPETIGRARSLLPGTMTERRPVPTAKMQPRIEHR